MPDVKDEDAAVHLVGGDDSCSGSDDDDQPDPECAANEEAAALKRAAALDSVNSIPMGQAFATLRQARKAGQTLRPEPVNQEELDAAECSNDQGAPAAPAQPDLDSLLPGAPCSCMCMGLHVEQLRLRAVVVQPAVVWLLRIGTERHW